MNDIKRSVTTDSDIIKEERNNSIDLLKILCAVLVIILHCPSVYRDNVMPLTRCAVPCFYMISGYLLYRDGQIGYNRLMRNLKRVLTITIYSSLLYLVWTPCLYFATGNIEQLRPTLKILVDWIIFNDYPFGFHLWYL